MGRACRACIVAQINVVVVFHGSARLLSWDVWDGARWWSARCRFALCGTRGCRSQCHQAAQALVFAAVLVAATDSRGRRRLYSGWLPRDSLLDALLRGHPCPCQFLLFWSLPRRLVCDSKVGIQLPLEGHSGRGTSSDCDGDGGGASLLRRLAIALDACALLRGDLRLRGRSERARTLTSTTSTRTG